MRDLKPQPIYLPPSRFIIDKSQIYKSGSTYTVGNNGDSGFVYF